MKEHYYTEKPTSELKKSKISARLRDKEFSFVTGSGVFSIKKVDNGTRLLIEECKIKGRVLDLGCGYGVVGIVIKKIFPDNEVVLSDINMRACRLARENAKLNNVSVDIVQGDMFTKVEGKFGTILLNPPQNAGKKICFSMIEQSKEYLRECGTLQLVARHQKGGKSLSKYMEEIFGNVDVLGRGSGFRVYVSQALK